MDEKKPRFSAATKKILVILGITIAFFIGAVLIAFFTQKDSQPTEETKTNVSDQDLPSQAGNPVTQDTVPSGSTSSAKVGDTFSASIPTASGDKDVSVTAKVTRIVKLLSETNGKAVDLRFCNEKGCHPMQPVAVGEDEALVVLDLEFNNSSTELNTAGSNSAYMMSQYFRFRVGESYNPVQTMAYNIFNDKWYEQEPTFYVSPSKRLTMTFFTRVPSETNEVEFLYGQNLSSPDFRMLLRFGTSLSDTGNGSSSRASKVSSDQLVPYLNEAFRTGKKVECRYIENSSPVAGDANVTVAVDGERFYFSAQYPKYPQADMRKWYDGEFLYEASYLDNFKYGNRCLFSKDNSRLLEATTVNWTGNTMFIQQAECYQPDTVDYRPPDNLEFQRGC